ncbi:immunoglobulin-like domain-containing protein [[Ruminococcus] torques]|uniref:immunoglobulin-like domain-containing protein n=1 Tax=[Ruminococcus] torques TaxID=33039 RepID=UPI0025A40EFF|nr:immunoglobulin-like domain-containing protein [[Ruminococcus] torques]MDM8236734.1 DUF5011 domain-containing protein [[Ruminococcus] torques]
MRIVRIILIVVSILSLGIFGISELIRFSGRDTEAPEITSDRDVLEIPCEYTQEQLMEGLSAEDETDGDLTSEIIAGSFSRFINTGECNLTYVVFDSSDQPATLTRKVRFTDYHPPRFTLTEPLVFSEQEGSYTTAMERLGASDQLDGDLKEWITQTDTDVNYQRVGTYTMSVEVSNSFGDTSSAALPVHVVSAENRRVDIALTSGIVYISAGESLDPSAYISGVTAADGSSLDPSAVTAESAVDTNTPGCYEVHYQVFDAGGNTGETWLTVIVEEGGTE